MFKNKSLLCLLVLFLITSFGGFNIFPEEVDTIELKPVCTLPSADNEETYFRKIPFFSVTDDGEIFAIVNLDSLIFKMDRKGCYLGKVGTKGRGPGDIFLPYSIETTKDRLIILDSIAFSFFELNGKFLSKFKNFMSIENFCVSDKHIYANTPRADKLITKFTYSGKIINQFGEKFKIDYSVHDKINPIRVDDHVNSSYVLKSEKHIFIVFKAFGEIHKYDLKGNLVEKSKINFFDKKIDSIARKHHDLCFKKGLIKTVPNGIATIDMLNGASIYNGRLYLMLSQSILINPKFNLIYVLNTQSLKTIERLKISNVTNQKGYLNTMCLAVQSIDNIPYFYVGTSDPESKDLYIGVYKK
jgi:hypothetical protein